MRKFRLTRVPSGGVIGVAGGGLLLVIAVLVAFSLSGGGHEPSAEQAGAEQAEGEQAEGKGTGPVSQLQPPPEAEETVPAADLVPKELFATGPRANRSTAEASLVDVRIGTGNGVERVTFTFEGGEVLPKYQVVYRDAVRLHPHDDPTPVEGNVYLIVSYELTDPNQANRLAFPPRIYAGPRHRQIAEVLLFDNLDGSLRFAIGLDSKAPFRLRTPKDPSRLVVEIKTP